MSEEGQCGVFHYRSELELLNFTFRCENLRKLRIKSIKFTAIKNSKPAYLSRFYEQVKEARSQRQRRRSELPLHLSTPPLESPVLGRAFLKLDIFAYFRKLTTAFWTYDYLGLIH